MSLEKLYKKVQNYLEIELKVELLEQTIQSNERK